MLINNIRVVIFFLSCYYISSTFHSPCEINMFHFPSSSFWVTIWKKYQPTSLLVECTAFFSWPVSNEKLYPYTLERRCIYSIIHGTPIIHKTRKFKWVLIHWPEGGEKETPHPTSPAALWPWSIRGELSPRHLSFIQALLPRWSGWGLAQESVPLEERGLSWESAMKWVQPPPPTSASARAKDVLLGSTRAEP